MGKGVYMAAVEQYEWLESFLAVVDNQSFSAAAEAIHRSQSRVSSHIAALERSLGATLFDRRHRPVALTDAGQTYLPYARKVLETMSQGADAVAGIALQPRGVVVVGTIPSAGAAFLSPIIAAMLKTHPDIRVESLEFTSVPELKAALQSGTADLALGNLWPLSGDEMNTHLPLWREYIVTVLPEGHDLADEDFDPIPPALTQQPVICIGLPGSRYDQEVLRAASGWNIDLDIIHQTQQPQTLMAMVRNGLGVGIINELACNISNTSGVIYRRLGKLHEGRIIALSWNHSRYMSRATEVVFEIIKNAPIPEHTFAYEAAAEELEHADAERTETFERTEPAEPTF